MNQASTLPLTSARRASSWVGGVTIRASRPWILSTTKPAMYSSILNGLNTAYDSTLWWSVIFGANPGGRQRVGMAVKSGHVSAVECGATRFRKSGLPALLPTVIEPVLLATNDVIA